MQRATVLLLLASACAPPTEPGWALGSVYLEPDGSGGADGFLTWNVYGPDWDRRMDERHYLCASIERITLTAGSTCQDCDVGWAVTARPLETDCGESLLADAPLPGLTALGLGAVPSELVADDPRPGESSGSWAKWGDGPWTTWGWAWPEEADFVDVSDDIAWDDRRVFVGWPAWAWELTPDED